LKSVDLARVSRSAMEPGPRLVIQQPQHAKS
jgi:hypothetical protein